MKMELCPRCGRQLLERRNHYYCPKDRILFDKQTLQEIRVQTFAQEAETDYEEAKRRFRANMKGLYRKTDRDVDQIIERYERFFAEKNYSPMKRIVALEFRQDSEIAVPKLGPSPGVGIVIRELSVLTKPVPLRGPLTPDQEWLTEARLRMK
jgi:uncharacterized Zn finger protein (UPF0148 family)